MVLVITEGNKQVESEELNYDPNGDRIWSDSATTMVEPGRVSEGLGFESDLNFRRTVVGPGSIRNTGRRGRDSGLMRPASSPPRVLRSGLSVLFWLSPAFLQAPAEASAQGDAGCDVPSHAGMVMTTLSNETRMFNFKSPTIRCPGGVMIRADSAVVFESTNYNNLMGNVVFLGQGFPPHRRPGPVFQRPSGA